MKISLKNTLLASLPLAGLLVTAPVAFAHGGGEHRAIHRELGDWHEDFHQMPHSRWEHRQFHRELKREHRALDRDMRENWGRDDYDRYSYGRPYYGDSYRGYSYDRYGYGRRPNYGNQYGYGSGSYDEEGYYPGSSYPEPYSLGPSSALPSLLGLPLDIFLPR